MLSSSAWQLKTSCSINILNSWAFLTPFALATPYQTMLPSAFTDFLKKTSDFRSSKLSQNKTKGYFSS